MIFNSALYKSLRDARHCWLTVFRFICCSVSAHSILNSTLAVCDSDSMTNNNVGIPPANSTESGRSRSELTFLSSSAHFGPVSPAPMSAGLSMLTMSRSVHENSTGPQRDGVSIMMFLPCLVSVLLHNFKSRRRRHVECRGSARESLSALL